MSGKRVTITDSGRALNLCACNKPSPFSLGGVRVKIHWRSRVPAGSRNHSVPSGLRPNPDSLRSKFCLVATRSRNEGRREIRVLVSSSMPLITVTPCDSIALIATCKYRLDLSQKRGHEPFRRRRTFSLISEKHGLAGRIKTGSAVPSPGNTRYCSRRPGLISSNHWNSAFKHVPLCAFHSVQRARLQASAQVHAWFVTRSIA